MVEDVYPHPGTHPPTVGDSPPSRRPRLIFK